MLSTGSRPALFAMIVLLSIAQTGCLYSALGVRHNFDVAEDLVPGLTREAALAAIADGGSISIEAELTRSERQTWADVFEADGILGELLLAQARQRREVDRVLQVYRVWGFMGFGEFHLFLDDRDTLVGYDLIHVN